MPHSCLAMYAAMQTMFANFELLVWSTLLGGNVYRDDTTVAESEGDPTVKWILEEPFGIDSGWEVKLQPAATRTPVLFDVAGLPRIRTPGTVAPFATFPYLVGPARLFGNDSVANKTLFLVFDTPYPLTSAAGTAAGIPDNGRLLRFLAPSVTGIGRSGAGTVLCFQTMGQSYPLANVPAVASRQRVLCVVFGTTTLTWCTNTDQRFFQTPIADVTPATLAGFYLCESFPGDIFELQVYPKMLSNAEVLDVIQLLVSKWSLA